LTFSKKRWLKTKLWEITWCNTKWKKCFISRLINTLNDKDLLINQLNNQLNELKDKVNSINFDKETWKALVT
jgi:hypothetical protein